MRLKRIPPSTGGTTHRAPSLDFRFPRRPKPRPPVVVPPGGREPKPPLPHAELFPDEATNDRRLALWALGAAVAFHATLLLIVWPQLDLVAFRLQ